MKNYYINPSEITKDEFLQVVTSNDISLVCNAVVSSSEYIDDYEWLVTQYSLLLNHENAEVRGITVTCIGHLARLYKIADKNQLLRLLKPLLSDEMLVGRAEDAIDDVNSYLN